MTLGPDLIITLSFIVPGTGDKTAQCPPGSAACKVRNDTSIDMGHMDKKLQMDATGHPTLTYTSNVTVPGCTTKPKTTIQFVCPESGGVRFSVSYF